MRRTALSQLEPWVNHVASDLDDEDTKVADLARGAGDIRTHLSRDQAKIEHSAGPSTSRDANPRQAAVAAREKWEEHSPKKRRSCGIPGCCESDPMRM